MLSSLRTSISDTGVIMEEKYKLEKEYTIKPEIFSEAYKEYQKKYVMKRSYIIMTIFLILAADFVYAVIKAPDNRLAYLLIVICIAMAFSAWHNPRFVRRRITETMREYGEPVYKIGISDSFIDISTVKEPEYDEPSAEDEEENEEGPDMNDIPDEVDPLPEKTRLELNDDFHVMEYNDFFLLVRGTLMFYVLPKAGFTEAELEIVRGTGK